MRHGLRRRIGLAACAALAAGALAVVPGAPASGAGEVSPTTNADDGSTGSLRYILENLPDATTTVVLPPGSGPYVLDECGSDVGGNDIDINDAVTIRGNGNTIRQTCLDRVLNTSHDLTLDGVVITGGRTGGDGGGVQVVGPATTFVVRSSTITGNTADDGAGIEVGMTGSGTVTIVDSTISGNSARDDGAGLRVNGASLLVVRSTISGNCAQGDGGALDMDGDAATFVNSTVSGNTSHANGAIDMDTSAALTLVYTDVVRNIHEDGVVCPGLVAVDSVSPEDAREDEVDAADVGDASNIDIDTGQLVVFGSIVALPIQNDVGETAKNCQEDTNEPPVGQTVSHGYNVSDDTTCGFTAATDRQNVTDPKLGPLADNGGPTHTHLPQDGSPLLDAIPVADCGKGDSLAGSAVTTDQRGVTRPQGSGCDIGSVEVVVPIPVIQPRFTG